MQSEARFKWAWAWVQNQHTGRAEMLCSVHERNRNSVQNSLGLAGLSCPGFVFFLKYFLCYSCVEKVISQLGLRMVHSKFSQVAPGTEAASSLSLRLVLSGQPPAWHNWSSPFAVVRAAASPALPQLEKPLDQNQQ